jgi:hypothetical protein
MELVNSLLECNTIQDKQTLEFLIENLPFHEQIAIQEELKEQVLNIVDASLNHPRGLEFLVNSLLDVQTRSKQMQRVFCVLQTISFLPISWMELGKLRGILKDVLISDEQLRQFYFSSVPDATDLPAGWEVGELLSCLQYNLARRICKEPDNSPLLEFLMRLLQEINQPKVKARLSKWITKTAGRLHLEPNLISARIKTQKEAVSERAGMLSYLLVKIEPSPWSDKQFEIKSWLLHKDEIHSLKESEDVHPFESLASLLDQLVREARWLLLDRSQSSSQAPAQLVLEVILPVALLNWDVDRWLIRPGKSSTQPVGAHCIIVLRSWERLYDSELRLSWELWKKKWNARPRPPLLITDAQVYWACAAGDYHETLYDQLENAGLIFLGLTPMPQEASANEAAVWGPMLDAGTPIALWLRAPHNDFTEAQKELRALIYTNELDSVPQLIFGKRKDVNSNKEEHSFWNHLALMWDDPDRLPPDIDCKLSAPQE